MDILEIEFSENAKNYGLRLDHGFYSFTKKELPSTLKTLMFPTIKLREFIEKINNGKNVAQEDYSFMETDYVYLTVNNIRKHEIVFNEIIFLNNDVGSKLEKNKLEKDDLIITRSGTVGICKLFDLEDEKIYIPSGYLIVIELKKGVNKTFIEYYLSLDFVERYIQIHAAGKTQQNISQIYIKRIPMPDVPSNLQEKLVKKIVEIEKQLKNEKQKLVTPQEVIEEVFIKYDLKSTKFEKREFEAFTTEASRIADQKFIRCGAQYRAFWDVHNGLLFEGKSKFPIVKLGSIMKLHKTKTLKKGILDKEYILIELEDIGSGSGKITNLERVITEIGSDKTYFNGCDLITTKLRPYLGYTILNNPALELIGTTELLPFKVDKDLAYHEYIKYLLLSHEYLEKSSFLMHGKEHPRIHPLDLLSIKIPLPDLETQKKIVAEIQEKEKINNIAQDKIKAFRKEISEIILTTLTENTKIKVISM
jgi:restriction endonuclease S subunit